jgi:hypothetical protein
VHHDRVVLGSVCSGVGLGMRGALKPCSVSSCLWDLSSRDQHADQFESMTGGVGSLSREITYIAGDPVGGT